ncbi:MAG: prephenate dehydrogenase [Candidatus Hydrogenedentota bacterium]
MKKLTIVGVGLIGGSVGLGLKRIKAPFYIIGTSRNIENLKKAYKVGAVDYYTTDFIEATKDSDIVMICVPVEKIVLFTENIIDTLKKGCIITDAGSTKSEILKKIDRLIIKKRKAVYFVGAHPLAGSEKTGVEFAKGHLFENAYCLITPGKTSCDKIDEIKDLWKSLNAIVVEMDAYVHDKIVGAISHLPHIVATALINTVGRNCSNIAGLDALSFAASGFRDTTRIAGSDAGLWKDIFLSNRKAILPLIDKFINELNRFKRYISPDRKDKLIETLNTAKGFKDRVSGLSHKGIIPGGFEIYLDVEDRVGVIASISGILRDVKINIKDIAVVKSREDGSGALRIGFESDEDRNFAMKVLKEKGFSVFR